MTEQKNKSTTNIFYSQQFAQKEGQLQLSTVSGAFQEELEPALVVLNLSFIQPLHLF